MPSSGQPANRPMHIVVCPLSKLSDVIELHRPDRVISMLDPGASFPNLGARYAGQHLRLAFHDVDFPEADEIGPSTDHVRSILQFLDSRPRTILIHCRAGVSRSTAAAFIAACAANPQANEHALAVQLRDVAPMARPNETLINLADAEMNRGGRMVAAIAETGRGLDWSLVVEGWPFVLDAML